MIKASYDELVKLIVNFTKLPIGEIEAKIDAKKAKLSDLISKEGAAQIVASELGVNFDKQKVKVDGLLVGMRKIAVTAKILRIYPVRSFQTKTATSKVANMVIADETGNIKCVLWDMNHIKEIEEGRIKEGDVIDFGAGSVRQGTFGKELHLGSNSDFKKSAEVIDKVVDFKPQAPKLSKRKINELKENERAVVRAVVVQAFEPKFFSVCPECGKKPSNNRGNFTCAQHGVIVPKGRSLMSMVLDDGTANIRAVGFNEVIAKMFHINEEEIKLLVDRKNEVLGKELLITGRVRRNKMFDNLEFIISDSEEIDPEKLIGELSK